MQDSNEWLAAAYDDLDKYDLKVKSMELQINMYKQTVLNTYISEGAVTVAGIAMIFIGRAADQDMLTSAGIGACAAGGVCLSTTAITQLIKHFKK